MIYDEIISGHGSKYPIKHLGEGGVILSQGEEVEYINILVSGSVYISHISDEGERLITGLFNDAQFLA